MGQINGAMIYVLFSSPKNSTAMVQRIISIPAEAESAPLNKVIYAISNHIGNIPPPLSRIKVDGMAIKLYYKDISCLEIAIKPLRNSPLSKITKQEWEIARAQIAKSDTEAQTIEASISAATSTLPKIICLDDVGYLPGLVEQKPLPKSAIFSAIVILGLLCSLFVVIRTARRTSK